MRLVDDDDSGESFYCRPLSILCIRLNAVAERKPSRQHRNFGTSFPGGVIVWIFGKWTQQLCIIWTGISGRKRDTGSCRGHYVIINFNYELIKLNRRSVKFCGFVHCKKNLRWSLNRGSISLTIGLHRVVWWDYPCTETGQYSRRRLESSRCANEAINLHRKQAERKPSNK